MAAGSIIGELRAAGEYNSYESPDFQFFFSKSHPPAPKVFGRPVLAIEFEARVRWVLEESSELRMAAQRPAGSEPAK